MHVQAHAFDYWRVGRADPTKRVVTDEREFWDVIRYVERHPECAYDCETNGVAWYRDKRICGFSLTVPEYQRTQSWYFPFRHQTGEQQIPVASALQGLNVILGSETLGKRVHNAIFEKHMARADGIEIRGPLRDTMVEAYLYDENFLLGLKDRARRDLNDVNPRAAEIVLDGILKERAKQAKLNITDYKDRFGYAQIPIAVCGYYAAYDTDATWRLGDLYDRHGVRQFFASTYQVEMDLVDVIVDMEEHGIPVDIQYIEYLRATTGAAMEHLAPQIFSALGYSFNLGSDDELRHVLVERLRLPLWKRTDSGALSVDKEVLEHFAEDHPACALILEWRQASKIKSTYTDSILEHCDANGILHGQFRPLGANTGRFASSNPNMQNFASDSEARAIRYSGKSLEDGGVDPWSVKRAFRTRDWEGMERGHYDYSQIELRVLAEYSGDPTMIDVYLKGEDIHKRTQMEVFASEEKVWRRPAKVINFGLCLSGNQLTLVTDGHTAGLVRLDEVRPDHLVWDGVEWVTHDGLVCRGEQEVVLYDGVEGTPDHVVYLEGGSKARLGCVASEEHPRRLARGADGSNPRYYYSKTDGAGAQFEWAVEGCGTCLWCVREKELAVRERLPRPQTRRVLVYDILNAGPRHRFTVSGKIVSNSYCLSDAGFARQAKISQEKATAFMSRFFERYPRIAPFREEFWAYCRANGGAFRNMFGRPRRVPGLLSTEGWIRGRSERQTIGSLIQGTAAELTKIALIRIHRWEKQNRTGLKLCSTIHDEVSIDQPKRFRKEIGRAVKAMMEDFGWWFRKVPIVVDAEVSDTNVSEKRDMELAA